MSSMRNIEEIHLEEIDEDYLRNQCIEMGMDLRVDTRQGSIYRDAAEGHIIRAAKFFDDLRMVKEIICLNTCTGDVLDEKLREHGLERNPPEATPARYYCQFNGAVPIVGDYLTCEGFGFNVESIEDRVVIVSEDTGTEMNSLPQGVPVIPEIDVDGLISCTLEEIETPAVDEEDDDSARRRLINKVSIADENGNSSHIQTWCESVRGVGRARILPLWNGYGTVKAIIIGVDGHAVSSSVIEDVQEYVDPGISGMGEGKASIGQFVTVVSAEDLPISVSVSVIKKEGATYATIKEKLQTAIQTYLKQLTMETWSSDIVVRYNSIGSIIINIDEVIEYQDLLLNGGTGNVAFTVSQTPVVGEVTVNGYIL